MKIFLFSQYFPPEIGATPQRVYEHAKRWVKSGHSITVVTCIPNSPYGKIYKGYRNRVLHREIMDGIQLYRLFTVPAGKKDRILIRFLNSAVYALFTILVVPIHILINGKPDIICATVPYSPGLPAFLVAKLFRIPFIYEMRDAWVQVIYSTGRLKMFGEAFYRLAFLIEYLILHHSDKVVVIGEEMAELIQKEYGLKEKPEVIHNAPNDELLNSFFNDKDNNVPTFNRKFVIGFIGNMSSPYDFKVLIKAAEELRNEPCVFVFVGEGIQKREVVKTAKEKNLINVKFYNAVPFKESINWIRKCDLTVIPLCLDPVYKICLPLKMFDSMALGRSVLVNEGNAAADLIRASGGGTVFDADSTKELPNLILQRMKDKKLLMQESKAAREHISKNLTREKMASKYLELFSSLSSVD